MKKIVIFIPSIEYGGVEKNLYQILNYLQRFYSEIYLLTSEEVKLKYLTKKIKIIFPKYRIWKNSSRLVKSIVCFFLLIKSFKNKRVLLFSFQSNIFSIVASKIISSPIIIRLNTSPEKYINNIFKKYLFKFFYSLSDEIIVNSYDFKKNIKKIFNLKSNVILNPFKLKKIKHKKIIFFKNFNGLKILSIGRLTEQKDHITLLKSINLLLKKNKMNVKLYLIGMGYNYDLLSKYIHKNNLKKNIKLAGYKNNAKDYLKSADLFILSSKYEGLPNVLLEAQSAGIPIISSNCPTGPREILLNGKLGNLFKSGDYNDLSKKILYFKKNKKKYIQKTILAKKYLFRFHYNANLKKYLIIINKYIKN